MPCIAIIRAPSSASSGAHRESMLYLLATLVAGLLTSSISSAVGASPLIPRASVLSRSVVIGNISCGVNGSTTAGGGEIGVMVAWDFGGRPGPRFGGAGGGASSAGCAVESADETTAAMGSVTLRAMGFLSVERRHNEKPVL